MELLGYLPAKNGMAFVIVQHLDPHHASRLAELLGKATQMPVMEVTRRVEAKPNMVYVQPPNKCVICKGRFLTLVRRTERINLGIDHFFESLAEAQGPRAIGVVLSGSGSDGTAGVRAIKAAGGITFAQDERSAKYGSMPRNAMLSGFVDAALSLKEIATQLGRIAEILVEREDGSRRVVAVNPTTLRDGRGKITGAINCLYDITERKNAEMELQEKKNELDLVIQQTPFMLTRCSRDYRYRYVSKPYAKLVGSTPEKIAGKSIAEVVGPEAFASIRPYIKKVLSGQRVEYEKLIQFSNGPRFLHVTYLPERAVNGEIVGWVASILDITARKKAAEAIAAFGRQQAALYEFVRRRHDAKSLQEIYTAANDAICATLSCDRAAILLFDADEVMRFKSWRGLSRVYRKKVEGHSPWKPSERNPQPIRIENIAQSHLPKAVKVAILAEGVQAAGFFPLVAEGKLIGKFMTYYDRPHIFTEEEDTLALNISGQLALAIERKRAEAALLRSEEVHRAFFSQTEVGMARSDLQGRIAFVNKKLCELVGYPESELIGKTFVELTDPEHQSETRKLFRDLVREGKPYHLEKSYIRKDGSRVWVNVTASPVRDANGKTRAAVAVVRDITVRKRALDALENANRLLETRVQDRTRDLVATNEQLQAEIQRRKRVESEILEISEREQRRIGQELHDSVCQHLTAIAFMVRSVAMRLKQHRVVDTSDLEKIARLINEGVTETRTIARGLHPVEMNPDGFAAALQSLLHRRSQLPYRLEIDDGVSPDASVALHLYRITSEAVINANKHARASEVVVRMRKLQNEIELSVADNGVGLSNNQNNGTGMGLHVMDYRARSIGARLEITCVKPHGTRVACYLPRK